MAKPSSIILRNKGVPVDVAVVESDGQGGWRRLEDGDANPKVEQAWVRFGANEIADIEDAFGSLEEFQEASVKQLFRTTRKSLAIAWGFGDDVRRAGLMMLDGKLDTYETAVGVALSIANGVDPTDAALLLEQGQKTSKEAAKRRSAAVKKVIADDAAQPESLGTNGSEPGSAQADLLTSSGD